MTQRDKEGLELNFVGLVTLWLIEAQGFQCADRILPRHLLTPLVNEISVVQRACFDVCGFRRGLNLIVVEWMTDQRLRSFVDLNRRRRNAAENDLGILYDPVATAPGTDMNICRNSQHWKIKCAATTKLLIRSAPAVRCRQMNIGQ